MLSHLLLVSLIAFCSAIPNVGSIAAFYVVDDFNATEPEIYIYTQRFSSEPQTSNSSTKSSTILGGQRDISVSFTSGPKETYVSSGVKDGFYYVEGPKIKARMVSEAVLTFAGLENAGLNTDFTQGNTSQILIEAYALGSTKMLATVTDMKGKVSTFSFKLNSDGNDAGLST